MLNNNKKYFRRTASWWGPLLVVPHHAQEQSCTHFKNSYLKSVGKYKCLFQRKKYWKIAFSSGAVHIFEHTNGQNKSHRFITPLHKTSSRKPFQSNGIVMSTLTGLSFLWNRKFYLCLQTYVLFPNEQKKYIHWYWASLGWFHIYLLYIMGFFDIFVCVAKSVNKCPGR
jgi:hypothetical protein